MSCVEGRKERKEELQLQETLRHSRDEGVQPLESRGPLLQQSSRGFKEVLQHCSPGHQLDGDRQEV